MWKKKQIKKELQKYASEERRKSNERFFKTEKGEYGEGDKFIGVRVPDTRQVVNKFSQSSLSVIKQLLYSKIHEERLLALLILVEQNNLALKNKNQQEQKKIVDFYLKHIKQVNNWDLVDSSAHYILGQGILTKLETKKILDKLVQSKNLWQRRIAIISTFAFIRKGKIDSTLRLTKKLLRDKEDLIHKTVGWMLRESWKLGESNKKHSITENKKGKLAQKRVEEFLIKNYNQLPRTTLRYATERMPELKRKKFLKGKF